MDNKSGSSERRCEGFKTCWVRSYYVDRRETSSGEDGTSFHGSENGAVNDCVRGQKYDRDRIRGYGNDRKSYIERNPRYGKDRRSYREMSPGYGNDRRSYRERSHGYGKDRRSYGQRSPNYEMNRGSNRVEEGRRGSSVLKNTKEIQEEKSRPRKKPEKGKRRLSKNRVPNVEFTMVHVEEKAEDIIQEIQTPINMTSGKEERVITLYPSGKDEQVIICYPSGKDERGVTLYPSGKDERVITCYPSGKDELVVTLLPSDKVKRIIMSLNLKEKEVEETKMIMRTLQEERRKVEEKESECQEEIVKLKQKIQKLWDEAKCTRKVDNYV